MKGADVFALYVESASELNKFKGIEFINRVVTPYRANGWQLEKSSTIKHFKNCVSIGVKGLGMMLKSFLF